MKAVGIIAEYNPFHNGHAYQIQKAKELSGADFVIVVMSGNFVQRGAPAILNKFDRAQAALQNGADLVFEIPTLWATASAEYFASAGISMLQATGCVNAVSFGCETENLPLLAKIADIAACEPEIFRASLSDSLKKGLNFPSARAKAVARCLFSENEKISNDSLPAQSASSEKNVFPACAAKISERGPAFCEAKHPNNDPDAFDSDLSERSLAALLASPNAILTIEYLKAIQKQHASIRPIPVLRKGGAYHDEAFSDGFCSATALRRHLLQPDTYPADLSAYVPKETAKLLRASRAHFLTENDFSSPLYYKLLSEQACGFAGYADGSEELSNRIARALGDFTGFQDFCRRLKSKETTYTRISRLLLHVLLDIRQKDYDKAKKNGYVPYLRLLGMQKKAACLLSEITKNSACPVVARPKKDAASLDPQAASMLAQDRFASDLYYGIWAQKNKAPWKNEFQRGLAVCGFSAFNGETGECP